MQYTIMMQKIPGDNSVYVSQLNNAQEAYNYTMYEEASTKKIELESLDHTGRIYTIASYNDEINISEE
jgi:hypothetical protein